MLCTMADARSDVLGMIRGPGDENVICGYTSDGQVVQRNGVFFQNVFDACDPIGDGDVLNFRLPLPGMQTCRL